MIIETLLAAFLITGGFISSVKAINGSKKEYE